MFRSLTQKLKSKGKSRASDQTHREGPCNFDNTHLPYTTDQDSYTFDQENRRLVKKDRPIVPERRSSMDQSPSRSATTSRIRKWLGDSENAVKPDLEDGNVSSTTESVRRPMTTSSALTKSDGSKLARTQKQKDMLEFMVANENNAGPPLQDPTENEGGDGVDRDIPAGPGLGQAEDSIAMAGTYAHNESPLQDTPFPGPCDSGNRPPMETPASDSSKPPTIPERSPLRARPTSVPFYQPQPQRSITMDSISEPQFDLFADAPARRSFFGQVEEEGLDSQEEVSQTRTSHEQGFQTRGSQTQEWSSTPNLPGTGQQILLKSTQTPPQLSSTLHHPSAKQIPYPFDDLRMQSPSMNDTFPSDSALVRPVPNLQHQRAGTNSEQLSSLLSQAPIDHRARQPLFRNSAGELGAPNAVYGMPATPRIVPLSLSLAHKSTAMSHTQGHNWQKSFRPLPSRRKEVRLPIIPAAYIHGREMLNLMQRLEDMDMEVPEAHEEDWATEEQRLLSKDICILLCHTSI